MICTYFGSPGVGKTTLACKKAKMNHKRYANTYCNFYNTVPGCGTADLHDLGEWSFPDSSYIAVDEAGIEYNNRAYKKLNQTTIAWFKKHRHYKCDVDVFSQSWDDMDVTIRRLSNQLWYMYKIGPWTLCRRVYKRVTVDKTTQQIIDGYKMAHMLWLLIWPLQWCGIFDKKFTLTFRPFYYKYFDSWSTDSIPRRDFPVYNPIQPKKEKGRGVQVITTYYEKTCAFLMQLYLRCTNRRS